LWVGEIAVERENGVLHLAVERMVECFDLARARGDYAERRIELRQVFRLAPSQKSSRVA
jgi:hypothetical protein